MKYESKILYHYDLFTNMEHKLHTSFTMLPSIRSMIRIQITYIQGGKFFFKSDLKLELFILRNKTYIYK